MKSLYGKLVLLTALIMVSSGLFAFLGINTYYHQVLKGQNDQKNMDILESITAYIEGSDEIDLQSYLETQASTGYKLFLIDEQGEKTLYGDPFRKNNLPEQAIDDVLNGKPYHGMANLPSETFVTGFFSDELLNSVGRSVEYQGERYALFLRPNIKLLFTEVHYILAGLFVLMGIISLLAMLIVAKKLIEPITELTIATEQVGDENFSVDLHIHRRDEIGKLAKSFRKMTKRLDENNRIRKEFISDVSHDFQSPLLNIKGYANLLLQDDLNKGNRLTYAQVIQSETERMSILTKQLLLLTSLDQLTEPLKTQPIQLDEQLKELVRNYRWLLEERKLTLSMNLEAVAIEGDPNFLEKTWDNLLSNALKYSDDGGEIEIELTTENELALVQFKDKGIGMDQATLARAFDRFYRADTSRTKSISGTGLGLSIAQEVVQLHGGAIKIESEEGVGTTCIVAIPKL